MAISHTYENVEPARVQIDELEGPVVVEFGTPWCGHCAAAQPLLEVAFTAYPLIRHIKIEDGPSRRLGRSFRVKLWPTLIFVNNGREVARLVRPRNAAVIIEALKQIG